MLIRYTLKVYNLNPNSNILWKHLWTSPLEDGVTSVPTLFSILSLPLQFPTFCRCIITLSNIFCLVTTD